MKQGKNWAGAASLSMATELRAGKGVRAAPNEPGWLRTPPVPPHVPGDSPREGP